MPRYATGANGRTPKEVQHPDPGSAVVVSHHNGPGLIERFALEYVKDLNATRAYLRVRPETTPRSASTLGARLLAKVDTQACIAQLRAEQADRLRIEADTLLRELAICAYSDIQGYVQTEDGGLGLGPQAHPLASRAISSIKRKVTTYGEGEKARTEVTVELRLWNKLQALHTLAQHLGLIGKGDEDAGGIGGNELIVRWERE